MFNLFFKNIACKSGLTNRSTSTSYCLCNTGFYTDHSADVEDCTAITCKAHIFN